MLRPKPRVGQSPMKSAFRSLASQYPKWSEIIFGHECGHSMNHNRPLYEAVILSCLVSGTGLHVVEGNISYCHDTIRLENILPLWLIQIHRIDCEYCIFRICNYFKWIRIFDIIFRNSFSYVSYKKISVVENHC